MVFAQSDLANSSNKPRVICFGDSITQRGYPEALEALLGVETANAGIGGNSTARALKRISKDVLRKNPDIVVIAFGTNDLRVDAPHVHVPLADFKDNLNTMIRMCDHQNIKPVLCTLPPIIEEKFATRFDIEQYNLAGGLKKLIGMYRGATIETAQANDVPLIDLNQLLADEEWLTSDGVHPSEAGNSIIAKHIAKTVSPLLEEIERTSGEPATNHDSQPFVHPGIAHTNQTLDFIKLKIASGAEPWNEAWEEMRDSTYAEIHWSPSAQPHIARGPYNDPDIGASEFVDDANVAYTHALLWVMTDEEVHAKKAAEILDAWSSTLESVSEHDARLLIGMVGHHFCNAAELLKHRWDGWPEAKQNDFREMLIKIWYPVIEDFHPTANGNWDASMMQTMIAMGVFLDDRQMFDRATNYFLEGKGNGAIENYFFPSGQCQESGRDQNHTQMGLEFLANTCETAWNQGVDLYQAGDNRLLKGFEYTAKYNLGFTVPYEPYKSFEGRYNYKTISKTSRGRLRHMYDKVFNHYNNRKGIDAPFTLQALSKTRPESKGGSSLPWSTLMFGKPLPAK